MEQVYAITIFLTIVGFAGLAAVTLIPVHRFLNREQQKAREWNEALRLHRESQRARRLSGEDDALDTEADPSPLGR